MSLPTSYGTLRVDETILPITSLWLVRGGIEIRASIRGPLPPASGPVRVFTAQGEPVTEQAHHEPDVITIPAVSAEATVVLTYHMHIERVSGAPSDA